MKRVKREKVIYTFEPQMQPVLEVEDGEILVFEANDCFFQQIQSEKDVLSEIDFDRVNPATGPVYVKGARPGDLLKVDILAIDVASKGASVVVPGGGLLGEDVTEPLVRVIPIVEGCAEYLGFRLPILPMIGVIGVAPSNESGPWPTATPYHHGGNMDTKEIRKGTSVYFPVAQEGALLALGDCHALMADGEVCISGLEIPAEVTVRVSVIKGRTSPWPLLETPVATEVLASGESIKEAAQEANRLTIKVLSQALQVSWEEAYILASLTIDSRISQLVDPKMTVRTVIPQSLCSTERFLAEL